MITIYTISCPITKHIKYVGKTTNFKLRINQHNSDRRQMSKIKAWIKSIKTKGLQPIYEVLEYCEESDWKWLEAYWYWLEFSERINPYKRNSSGLKGSESRKLKVLELDSNNKVIATYTSIKNAEVITGVQNIGSVCRGVRPHAQKRKFIFAIDSTLKPV